MATLSCDAFLKNSFIFVINRKLCIEYGILWIVSKAINVYVYNDMMGVLTKL